MRCKAAIVPKMGLDIVVEEVELNEPKDYEVRLKIMTCTICHSDIHALTGEHGKYEGPGIAGHEIAGIVDKCGSKVTYVKPGDRVLCTEVHQGCGHCDQCLHDRHWFCENTPHTSDEFRIPSPYTRLNGERIIQTCSGASGFAEYTNAHESMLCKLDDDIPFEIGSALACGFMSGFGAVLNRCKIKPGESFAVTGCNYMEFLTGKRITGSVMGAVTLRRDIPKYMDMYRKGMIDIDALLTHRFGLDQIKEALEDSTKGALKNVVVIGTEK